VLCAELTPPFLPPPPPSLTCIPRKREYKIKNLEAETSKITAKERQEGGLTQGQAATLVRGGADMWGGGRGEGRCEGRVEGLRGLGSAEGSRLREHHVWMASTLVRGREGVCGADWDSGMQMSHLLCVLLRLHAPGLSVHGDWVITPRPSHPHINPSLSA
jgi:hypothetical protein